jgi:cysteine desulfurase family protein
MAWVYSPAGKGNVDKTMFQGHGPQPSPQVPLLIYLDNAATSWPKPESVYETADRVFRLDSGNPGRSGHRLSLAAGRHIERTRLLTARLFNAPNPASIIFTLNTTDSLNLALKGIVSPGDHVITSSMEHNSVARPLETLAKRGVEYTKVRTSSHVGVDPAIVKEAIKSNTALVVMTHISNVTGTENPIAEIGALCRERGIIFLVDAAQSAGNRTIDVRKMNIDLLAFPGHKGLLGPQGTGGLYIREGLVLCTQREGGTGSHSEDLRQPEEMPNRFESGTANTAGIAALGEGVALILEEGAQSIGEREAALASRLIEGMGHIPGIKLYGPVPGKMRSGTVSFTFESLEPAEAALILDNSFGIAVRSGLHCAPDAHRTIGTLDSGGTVRISIGYFTTEDDINKCLEALKELAQQ